MPYERQVVAALVLLWLWGSASGTAQTASFGRTIAGITVGQDDLAKVRLLYGGGAETDVQDVRTLCYFIEADQAYLSVSTFERQTRVRNITLTTFSAVMPGCHDAKIRGKHLTGPAGVRLGASMQTVIAALGKPSDTGKMQLGKDALVYADYATAGGRGTCQFEGDKLVLLALELSPQEDKPVTKVNSTLITAAQQAAVAAVNFPEGDATAFNRSRSDFTPEGWNDFLKPMAAFLDPRGAPTFTSTFVAAHDAKLISEKDGVLRLRIPGTLTQSNKIGRTTYRQAAIEVYVLRARNIGETSIKIQRLEQITCAGASLACQ